MINKFLYPKGGADIITLETGRLLSSKGHEVSYWGMKHPKNPLYPHSELFIDNIEYNRRNSLMENMRISINLLYSWEARLKIERFINIDRPDIVHLNNIAHQISPSILHIFKKYNIPTVHTVHDYKLVCPVYTLYCNKKPCEQCADGRYYRCLINKCAKRSYSKSFLNTLEMYLHHRLFKIYNIVDIYIPSSIFMKNKCREMGFMNQSITLSNFVDSAAYCPSYAWTDNTICYLGRLSHEKGLITLIDAVSNINVKLNIIGDGPEKESLVNRVKSYNIKNVNFLGHKSGDELKQEVGKCMFIVTPSEWYENYPRSIVESFAMGKPCVGARIGGIPELVIDNVTGLTFESGNVDDLAFKIEYMLKNPDKIIEMGKAARKFAEDNLGKEKHYNDLMDIYKEAIDKHKRDNR